MWQGTGIGLCSVKFWTKFREISIRTRRKARTCDSYAPSWLARQDVGCCRRVPITLLSKVHPDFKKIAGKKFYQWGNANELIYSSLFYNSAGMFKICDFSISTHVKFSWRSQSKQGKRSSISLFESHVFVIILYLKSKLDENMSFKTTNFSMFFWW